MVLAKTRFGLKLRYSETKLGANDNKEKQRFERQSALTKVAESYRNCSLLFA